jgi:hypothetical protein
MHGATIIIIIIIIIITAKLSTYKDLEIAVGRIW